MTKQIYKIAFHGESIYTGTEHYYTSVAAIYDDFTASELGIALPSLWAAGVSKMTYSNKLVMISRVRLHSKRQKPRDKRQGNE